jgi:hypothetical protein
MRDFFGVLCVRFVHWWDRHEDDAQETFNEALHLAPHYGEHAAHAAPWLVTFASEAMGAIAIAAKVSITNLSAAAGVLYCAVTLYQIRLYGLRGWLHWGAGTGVEGDIRRVVHRVEHDVEDEIRHVEVDMAHAFHPDYDHN